MDRIYFDNAATSLLLPEVAEHMMQLMHDVHGNPSSIHSEGRKARTVIEEARKTVAQLLHASPGEIFFTSGGTEADNMAIRQSVASGKVAHIFTTKIEHHAILHTIEELAKENKIQVHYLPITSKGYVDTSELPNLFQSFSPAMLCLMHANNEIGNMIDLESLAQLCVENKVLFHCDAVQTLGHYAFNLQETPISFLAGAAHKFNGPKGVGFIYIRSDNPIHPLLTGGSQERNMRGGTENVYGISGLAKALQIAYDNFEKDKRHIQSLKSEMIEQLKNEIPGVSFNGDPEGQSLYTVLNVRFPKSPNAEMMLFNLDIHGVACSGGSACSSGSQKGSHVMEVIGVEENRANVRFSFGPQNTLEEVHKCIQIIKKII